MARKKNKDKDESKAPQAEAAAPEKMKRKVFEQELEKLQVELTRLQAWVKAEGKRIIVVFEGRDTAGKGGVISRITARTSPRVYKHMALPAPSDREKSQLYIATLHGAFSGRRRDHPLRPFLVQPGRGRASDGLLHRQGVRRFPVRAPSFERNIQDNGIILLQVLPRRQPGRAAAPLRGAGSRSR